MPKRTWFTEFSFTPTEAAKFWAKVNKTSECWLWLASPNPSGYGVFATRGTSIAAHRASYLSARGPIPDGLVLDHLCRVRTCVNPNHLEPVTSQTNSRRSPLVYPATCSRGHEFTPENTRMYVGGLNGVRTRHCLICGRARAKKAMSAKRRRDGAVPFAERTHCGKGHELTRENTYVQPSRPNARQCRICRKARYKPR